MCWPSSIHCRMTGELTANNQDPEILGFLPHAQRFGQERQTHKLSCGKGQADAIRLEFDDARQCCHDPASNITDEQIRSQVFRARGAIDQSGAGHQIGGRRFATRGVEHSDSLRSDGRWSGKILLGVTLGVGAKSDEKNRANSRLFHSVRQPPPPPTSPERCRFAATFTNAVHRV
jgi:hypothetical protein